MSTCSSYEGAYFISPEVVIYVVSGRQQYSEWSNSTVKVLPDYTFGGWGSSLNTVRLDAIESLPYRFGGGASIRNLIAPNLKMLNGDLRYLTSFDLPNVESISSDCNYFGQYVSYINLPKLPVISMAPGLYKLWYLHFEKFLAIVFKRFLRSASGLFPPNSELNKF